MNIIFLEATLSPLSVQPPNLGLSHVHNPFTPSQPSPEVLTHYRVKSKSKIPSKHHQFKSPKSHLDHLKQV